MQAEPVRTRVTGMPRFTQVRGGGYFFMPGIRAVRFLAVTAMTIRTVEAILERSRPWAPLPLRVALGIGLMIHGGIKLFVPGGHENIAHLIGQLGVPLPA